MKNITLLSLVAAALLFTACGEKTKEAATDAANAVTEAVKADTTSVVEVTKQTVADVADAAKEKAAELAVATAKKAEEVKVAAEAKAADAAAALKKRATAAVSATPASPAAYAKCKSCHGADGKTKALGKSAVIAGQSKEAIIASMHAYKAGTRNVANMGMLMKGQVASMSDADIEAVAEYLSQL